jgi:hypothetical protein
LDPLDWEFGSRMISSALNQNLEKFFVTTFT